MPSVSVPPVLTFCADAELVAEAGTGVAGDETPPAGVALVAGAGLPAATVAAFVALAAAGACVAALFLLPLLLQATSAASAPASARARMILVVISLLLFASARPQARVEIVTQRIAQHVIAEHGDEDGGSR